MVAQLAAANVAIATGAPGPDVLDVDVKPEGSGWRRSTGSSAPGCSPAPARSSAPGRGGLHVYYTGTGQGCHALPRHHLDFKASRRLRARPADPRPRRPRTSCSTTGPDRGARLAGGEAAARPAAAQPRPPDRPWGGGELPPAVQRALAADATDRSTALYRLVGACVRAGLDEDAIHQLAGSYQPALEKYGAAARRG